MIFLKLGDICPKYIRELCSVYKNSSNHICTCHRCIIPIKNQVCIHCPMEMVKQFNEFNEVCKDKVLKLISEEL